MNRILTVLLLSCVFLLCAGFDAKAELVTFDFTGILDSVTDPAYFLVYPQVPLSAEVFTTIPICYLILSIRMLLPGIQQISP